MSIAETCAVAMRTEGVVGVLCVDAQGLSLHSEGQVPDGCSGAVAEMGSRGFALVGDGGVVTAEGPMGFFVVYTPTGESYFCAEPVSNATDAVNLVSTGRDDSGLLVLEPGQGASARVVFAPRGPA